jgi:hypothetical protein
MQLEPLYTIPLVYQITDPSDSTTYYVRSVMKDTTTGTVLASTNLSAQGSGRYTGSMTAPQDPTGFGRHIDVVTSVYTDAGYTTYSENYALKVNNYVVRRQVTFGGGNSGSDVDYDKIRKIMAEEVKKAVDAKDIPPTDLNPVLDSLGALQALINAIEIPEPEEKVDLTPVISEVRKIIPTLSQKITDIKIPEPSDLQPVIEEVKKISSEVLAAKDAVINSVEGIEQSASVILDNISKVSTELSDTSNKITEKNNQFKAALNAVIDTGISEQKKTENKKVSDSVLSKYFPQLP